MEARRGSHGEQSNAIRGRTTANGMQRLSLGSPLALGNPEISSNATSTCHLQVKITTGASGRIVALVIFLPVLLEFAHVYINGPPESDKIPAGHDPGIHNQVHDGAGNGMTFHNVI